MGGGRAGGCIKVVLDTVRACVCCVGWVLVDEQLEAEVAETEAAAKKTEEEGGKLPVRGAVKL